MNANSYEKYITRQTEALEQEHDQLERLLEQDGEDRNLLDILIRKKEAAKREGAMNKIIQIEAEMQMVKDRLDKNTSDTLAINRRTIQHREKLEWMRQLMEQENKQFPDVENAELETIPK